MVQAARTMHEEPSLFLKIGDAIFLLLFVADKYFFWTTCSIEFPIYEILKNCKQSAENVNKFLKIENVHFTFIYNQHGVKISELQPFIFMK